jgi:hypothetical protein
MISARADPTTRDQIVAAVVQTIDLRSMFVLPLRAPLGQRLIERPG